MTLEDRLAYLESHDALTGLYNWQKYHKTLKILEKEVPKAVGFVYLDINGLQSINRNFGYDYGDIILNRIAKVLQKCFEKSEIYRIGGDEFVAMVIDQDRSAFQKMVNAARQTFTVEMKGLVSIGCSFKECDIDLLKLTQHASEQKYVDKQAYFRQQSTGVRSRNADVLKWLLEELENRKFEMYLQPKGTVETLEVVGAEALVRYINPEGEVVQPGKFIPMLEQEGIIKYIDLFIFEEVCGLLDRWQCQKRKLLPISLNFSRLTLMDQGLLVQMQDISNRYSFPKRYITIEVTESVGEMELFDMVQPIKEMGFGVSLDDFGASYSSIIMLVQMDYDAIKLDRSLVLTLLHNRKSRIVVQHIIETCQELGSISIAEGVENFEQLNILKKLGCDWIQGYLLSEPVPVEEFEKNERKE